MIFYISKNKLLFLTISIAAVIVLSSELDSVSLFLDRLLGISSDDFVAFAQNKNITVIIPKGAANPEVDMRKLAPVQWYKPSKITVNQNDTVMWINKDTEFHTVTSGIGAGLESLLNNKQGTKNGIFDSRTFDPGGNWTYKFTNAGVYPYFCTIHPWMEGTIVVNKVSTIPNFPVDASGQRQTVFPVHTLTKDNKYDIDLAWSPNILLTGEKISFILDFSDAATDRRLHLLPYDFAILQNGNEILRKSSSSETGSDIQEFLFTEPGPINIRVENVGGDSESITYFNSTVYENPSTDARKQLEKQQPQSSGLPKIPFKVTHLMLVLVTYTIVIVIPAAVAVVYILYKKGII